MSDIILWSWLLSEFLVLWKTWKCIVCNMKIHKQPNALHQPLGPPSPSGQAALPSQPRVQLRVEAHVRMEISQIWAKGKQLCSCGRAPRCLRGRSWKSMWVCIHMYTYTQTYSLPHILFSSLCSTIQRLLPAYKPCLLLEACLGLGEQMWSLP